MSLRASALPSPSRFGLGKGEGGWWADRRIGEGGMGDYFSLFAKASWGEL